MQPPAFVQVATDPTLIKGIYDTCDQWCMYCHATSRCLAYRCSRDSRSAGGDVHRSLADSLFEGMAFMKRLCEAEGRPTQEIDAMLSDDPRTNTTLIDIDDPLERMGRRYAQVSAAYLRSRRDFPLEMRPRASGPTSVEILAWYHMQIAAKICRALISAATAARGEASRDRDALMAAKVALIGIDRSLAASRVLAAGDDDPRHELMQAELRRLRHGVEARFPEARHVVRPGLDDCPDWGKLD
jgi:hypothetical protein